MSVTRTADITDYEELLKAVAERLRQAPTRPERVLLSARPESSLPR
jgi:hypothetical protein